jgi:hypothetical protein
VLGVALPEQPQQNFEVWEENWDALVMWSRVQTQWRTSMGGVVGLDYGAIAWVFRLYEVDDQRSLLEDLQVMEAAAMAKLNERSD